MAFDLDCGTVFFANPYSFDNFAKVPSIISLNTVLVSKKCTLRKGFSTHNAKSEEQEKTCHGWYRPPTLPNRQTLCS